MKQAGFTLIELLVTATIIIILSGASLATYLDYRDRSATNNDASSVAERLRTAQVKAVAVEIPSGCTTVSSYVVSYGGTDVTVTATCPGVGSVAIPDLSLTLSNSVFQSSGNVTFDSRTVAATGATIDICGSGKLFTVTVSGSANVSKPVFAGSC